MGERMTAPTPSASPAAPEPTTPPAPDAQPPAQAKPETDWKAEARKHEARAKENAAAAAELALLKESQKTEAQKLADRAAQAEKERDEARLDALRMKVGASKRLPADVIDRLRGETEEELAADADRLAEHFKASVRPSGSADQGPRGTAPTANPAQAFADFLHQHTRQ